MNGRLLAAIATLAAIGACRPDTLTRSIPEGSGFDTSPARIRGAVSATDLGYGGPPSRTFGPDTYAAGEETGQGISPVGLQCPASAPTDPIQCSGFLASTADGTLLDVTVLVPAGAGPFPLVALLHGYGGSKTTDQQYNKMLTDAGYTVLRYSARGFGDSWGKVNLADIHLEIADLHSLLAQVVDDPRLRADGNSIGVFGASYGGGTSWLAAVQPLQTSPGGNTVRIRTIVPIVPWSDLLYSLRTNGHVENSVDVPGAYKLSFLQGLFLGGIRRNPQRPYLNYPAYFALWDGYILATEPNNLPPLGSQIVDGIAGYRSISWQQEFWDGVRGGTRIPVFELQGFTDDLFPLPEALRMYYALRAIDPAYPIALYLGDIGHPRAATKQGEVDFALGLIMRWFNFYLKGVGTPPSGVMAAITRPRDVPFSAADVVTVGRYDDLATAQTEVELPGDAVITFNPANPSGFFFDPFVMLAAESFQPLPPSPPSDFVPGDVAVYSVAVSDVVGNGHSLLVAGQPAVKMRVQTAAPRVQLDVRLIDRTPAGGATLITRGTLTLDAPQLPALAPLDVIVPTYGNLWQAAADDSLRLEITNVDSPYLTPSRVPSVTQISGVRLTIPYR